MLSYFLTQESTSVELNRRSSTGGILKRIRDNHWQHWDKEDGLPTNKEPAMPDPKFHEKQELYNRRERQAVMVGARTSVVKITKSSR